MFQKVKRWLGIEGVKVDIEMPLYFKLEAKQLAGRLKFSSMDDHTIQKVELKFIEKYKRGRGKSKLIDEYILGKIILVDTFQVSKEEETLLDFMLPFTSNPSAIEKFGNKNFLTRGLAYGARLLKGANSDYRLEVRVKVKDTRLDPIAVLTLIPD